jgi:tyrosyl-tRNA synthetase
MTFSLLLTSDGRKMGKTEKGAVWLNPEKTPPYEFYQYWRNVADSDVEKCLSLLTFLPMEEVKQLCSYSDERINDAKITLAYEVTRQVHGQDEADKAKAAAEALFEGGAQGGSIPETSISSLDNLLLVDLLQTCGLTASRGEGRRLIAQGGVTLNGVKVTEEFLPVTQALFQNNALLIKKGKKIYHKVVLG